MSAKRARRDERYRKLSYQAKREPRVMALVFPEKVDASMRRSCLRKNRYRSDADAREVITTLDRDYPLYSYECQICGGWHITSKAQWGSSK